MNQIRHKLFVEPGSICLPSEPTLLYTVVGSGVVITIYDTLNGYGGMNYYIKPIRENKDISTPLYACPAIIGLVNLFLEYGAKIEHLEASIYGGADNPKAEGYIKDLGANNIKVGLEILNKLKLKVIKKDIGSEYGRKIVFNSLNGEAVVAKVERIRASDWYPKLQEPKKVYFLR